MKPISWIATVAGAMAFSLSAHAQTQSQVQGQTQMQTQPADTTQQQQQPTPAPIVIETKVDLTTGGPQSPESLYDAQKEASAALAEAKTACRQQSRSSQADCLRRAQDDYHETLARARR